MIVVVSLLGHRKTEISQSILIELLDVSKYYGSQPAVRHLSFQVHKGEVFGLIGTSGCGKTTTLKMINRLVEPSEGTIIVDGKEVAAMEPEILRRQIGYVIQNVGLFPHYTVRENIETVPNLLDWDDHQIESRSKDLLQLVGLDHETFADRLPDSLSGGQQQRVGLARALAVNPSIILMDEPFGALDPITKKQIRREVSTIFTEIDKTIVLVTHDVFEAIEMCDRLCLLDDGVVQQIGTPKDLIFKPANDFVDSFFESDRFRLELLSVMISDILESSEKSELYWSPPLDKKKEKDDLIDPKTSLYEVIEKIEKATAENTVVIHRIDGQVTDSLNFSNLFDRFQQFKKSLKAEDSDG